MNKQKTIKYVALMRGIGPSNPNMRNEKLREVFEKIGFKNVQTVISSGNVLFSRRDAFAESSPKDIKAMETKIEKAFPKYLGFNSTTIIRSYDELESLIKKNPFKGIDDTPKSRLNVTFLKNNSGNEIKFPYKSKDKTYTLLENYRGAICSVIDLTGFKTPDLMIWLEKQFGKEITTRTWKTVYRIINKMNQ